MGVAADGSTGLGNDVNGVELSGTTLTIGSNLDGTSDSFEGNVISDNGGVGLRIFGSTMGAVNIYGNYIGVDATGIGDHGNTGSGIGISDTSSDASTINIGAIGTISASDGINVVGYNGGFGIDVSEVGPNSTVTIQNNYVGYESDGTTDAGNSNVGVGALDNTASNYTLLIGTDGDGISDVNEGNRIGNNNVSGAYVSGNGVQSLTFAGNLVASNVGGGLAIVASDLTSTTMIGGEESVQRNVFIDNSTGGVLMSGTSATPFTIGKNYFGVESDGVTPNSNGGDCLRIRSGSTITIVDNVISSCDEKALNILGGIALQMYGNRIGANSSGLAPLPFSEDGLYVDASTITSIIIGGAAAWMGNIFVGAGGGDGIHIENVNSGTTPITIQGNYIGVCAEPSTGSISSTNLATCRNAGDGIDIAEGAITIGGNNSLGALGTGTIAEGNVIANNYTHGVNIWEGPGASISSLVFLGNIVGQIRSTASGVFNVAAGNGDAVNEAGVLLYADSLTSVTIGGIGTTTASSKRNVISSGSGNGIVIQNIDDSSTTTIVNNYVGTDWLGSTARGNAVEGIHVLDGNLLLGGISSGSGNVISGNGSNGVVIQSNTGAVTIQGNTIGLSADGTADLGNGEVGINFSTLTSANTHTIGGINTAARNYISGNGFNGINIQNNTSTYNIYNNIIGLNAAGTAAIRNDDSGIQIMDLPTAVNIGNGTSAGRNIISGNGDGVALVGGDDGIVVLSGGDISILGNYIGVAADGTTVIANATKEIYAQVYDASPANLTIGGSESGYANTINNSTHLGVEISGLIPLNEVTIDTSDPTDGGLDTDNTWTDMVGPFALTDPSYRFWSRSVGGEVANYGPRQCYDGADNEDSPDGLIDYGSDLECESYLDDSEVPGSSSGGGGGESDEGEEVVDTEGQPEEEIEEVEIEDEVVEEVEETVPEIIDEPADPTPRKPLIVDVGDVVEEVEDAGSNTVDTISGIKQAKEERETIIDSIIEQDVVIEEEVLVEKTEEQERISSILEGIVDTIDEENLARVTAKLDAVVEKEVSRILDEVAAPSSSGGSSSSRIVLKTGGVDKEVTPDTEIVTLLDATLASESQQQAIEDEEDVVYISPSTTPEVSETSILKIIEYGGDVNDELIDDKVFMKGLSGISDRSTRIQDILPPSPIITNLDGLTVGLRILAWTASSNVGDELTYYIVDRIDPDDPDTWDIQKIAEVVVGEDYKAAPLIDLEPYLNLDEGDEIKEVDLLVQNQDGLGEYVKITVDPKLEFEARELHLSRGEIIKVTDPKGTSARRGAHNFSLTDSMKTSVWLAIAHAAENETGKDLTAHPSNRQLTGYYDPGTTVFVTWKSVVLNSVVIADASQGYFEVDVPEDLEEGDHTVLVYAYNEKTSWISNVNSMLFNTW